MNSRKYVQRERLTDQRRSKRFTRANEALRGKIFDMTSREAVHQFADTLKAIADHVGQQYTHGGDVRFMIENLTDYTFVRPPNPQDGNDQYELESWKKQLIYIGNAEEYMKIIK
jgi:hypothetical protein